MSKSLKDIAAAEAAANKAVAAATKKLLLAKKKLEKILDEWPEHFRCKKCGLAFKVKELGYKTYEILRNDMQCQYGG